MFLSVFVSMYEEAVENFQCKYDLNTKIVCLSEQSEEF